MHLIHQHRIEVNCQDQKLGKVFRDDLRELLETQFYPKLERLMQTYDDVEKVLYIDKLPLVLNQLNAKHWKTDFIEQSMQQIEMHLRNQMRQIPLEEEATSTRPAVRNIPKREHALQLFISFLKTGTLEANVLTNQLDTLFELVVVDELFVNRVKEEFKGKLQAILRWSLNIPKRLKMDLLGVDDSHHELKLKVEATKDAPRRKDFLEFLYWMSYFNMESLLVSDKWIPELRSIAEKYFALKESELAKLWKQHFKESDNAQLKKDALKVTPLFLEAEKAEAYKRMKSDHSEALYIENSGLVLLHPFLPKFFTELGFQEKGIWKDETSQYRACIILQYLVRFTDRFFENELVLNKIQCGIPITDTVYTIVEISPKEKELSQQLLQAVITYWKILKNTSVEGLQESFIQRSGRLVLNKNEHYELTIEQKSYDLLLDQLPWAISMIKTPWMEELLVCNWN